MPAAGAVVAEAGGDEVVVVTRLDTAVVNGVGTVEVAVLDVVDDVLVVAALLLPPTIDTVATLTLALLSWAGDAAPLLTG